MRLLVTGGAGFIGSALVRLLLAETDADVVNFDKLTYAANPEALEDAPRSGRYTFRRGDVADAAAVSALFDDVRPDAVFHLAAETHVDRSIDGPAAFVATNVLGTSVLLDAALRHWRGLAGAAGARFRFVHMSTDEVFGSLGLDAAPSGTDDAYAPSSPYAASKAAADHLVLAWHRTYGLPALLVRACNNYGPWQFPEKLLPLMLTRALSGDTLPVYGRGENVREWLHVADTARGLLAAQANGRPGAGYNLGSGEERANLALVRTLCRLLDGAAPAAAPYDRLIRFVADRPGHDLRYALNSDRAVAELGWRPSRTLDQGLAETVRWYLARRDWWQGIADRRGARIRHGSAA